MYCMTHYIIFMIVFMSGSSSVCAPFQSPSPSPFFLCAFRNTINDERIYNNNDTQRCDFFSGMEKKKKKKQTQQSFSSLFKPQIAFWLPEHTGFSLLHFPSLQVMLLTPCNVKPCRQRNLIVFPCLRSLPIRRLFCGVPGSLHVSAKLRKNTFSGS